MTANNKEKGPDEVILDIKGSLATIRLGTPGERMAIFTERRLDSLAKAIASVKEKKGLRGLIIMGPERGGFCAGVDIHIIQSVCDPEVGKSLAKRGQEVFGELSRLGITTVAAIHGPCVGGGCELALACNFRVATTSTETKIGLPETKLGIIPGFGGTQRLPRLIGITQALDIILKGKTLTAEKSFEIGLTDKLVTASYSLEKKDETNSNPGLFQALEAAAKEIALGNVFFERKKLSSRERFLTYTSLGRLIVSSTVHRRLVQETKGHYPALFLALEVLCIGLKKGLEIGLQAEAEAIGKLVATTESKSLIHIYISSEEAGKLGRVALGEFKNVSVAVLGGGTMGAGIAASVLGSGFPVVLVEPQEEVQIRAKSHIEKILQRRRWISLEKRNRLLHQLRMSANVNDIAECQVVIEAVVENLDIKKDVFTHVSRLCSPRTIIATNTSSLSVTTLALHVLHPDRVVGVHFFNPAEKMPLVEVIRGKQTGKRAIVHACALASLLGKYPVVVEDVPGFLVNRILSVYLVEAAFLLCEGFSIARIDKAAVDFGMPMGPIRLLDEIGLDVAAKVAEILEDHYGTRFQGPAYAAALVKKGRLGKKSGLGFYRYPEGKKEVPDPSVSTLLGIPSMRKSAEKTFLSDRLILPMVNEAVRCLDEGVAGAPSPEAMAQIDLATVMGIGFPPFRGGVLTYAEGVGIKTIYEKLLSYSKQYEGRFAPCAGIDARANCGFRFSEGVKVG